MLTSDLALNWRHGDKIVPRFIRVDYSSYLHDAKILIAIFNQFEGKTRGELEAELEKYIGTGTDYRILRGFIKLLTDRTEFDTSSFAEPSIIRQKLFLEAKKIHPVLPDSQQRSDLLESVAKDFETEPQQLLSGIYADLSQQQKLISFSSVEPEGLLERYNLAQAQALLYKCIEMKIRVFPSEAENYRSIFGWIKHFGLIHSVFGNAENGYEITLTGAASIFHRSQKYGILMSVFLPALLLCKNWKLSAEIAQKVGENAFYEISSDQKELNSYYSDVLEYKNSDAESLKIDWEKSKSNWLLKENREIVDLGKTAFVPDFILISPEEKKVFLDVIGFWTPKSLKKRLLDFESANFQNFIFAAGQELRGTRDEPIWEHENVLFYKTKILPRNLETIAQRLVKLKF